MTAKPTKVEMKAGKSPPAAAFVEEVGPTEVHDPVVRTELKRASVWIGLALIAGLVVILIQPILLIIGGMVIASMLDGGTRLLHRILPIPRWMRLTIVIVAIVTFLYWTIMLTGSQLADQAVTLQQTVQAQLEKLGNDAQIAGIKISAADWKSLTSEALNSVGRVTAAVSSVMAVITNLAMMLVLAVFLAADPRLYERGVAWMLPLKERGYFYGTTARIGATLRRLMAGRMIGMTIEGIGTWLLLAAGGVPMAALLGILTGLFAFLPNIGAIISGILMVLVGFSAGTHAGVWAIAVYAIVHLIDGWLIAPIVAKKSVDLAPALVLSAQLLFGALFGVLGLALADPIIAMIKVALERQSERNEARHVGATANDQQQLL
jgi:predicted PurR-regulated permease PerM